MYDVTLHGAEMHFVDDGFTSLPYVYRPLERGRVYEQVFLEHIRSLDRAGVYVDVGAHLGTHTVWFAKLCPSSQVHAFEPVRRYADVVRRNVEANHLTSKVVVHNIGLSDTAGEATNYLSPEHQIGFVDGDPEGVNETFQVRRLDDVVHGPVAVIKLDVEGMESSVLRGARRILSRHRPAVYAEAHTDEAAQSIEAELAPFGYRATGRIFNSMPTYEYLAPPRSGIEHLRSFWNHMPTPAREVLGTAAGAASRLPARARLGERLRGAYRRLPKSLRQRIRAVRRR